jgi:hypothetical protein
MTRSLLTLLGLALVLVAAAPESALAAHPDAFADSSGAWPAAAAAHRPGRWSLDFSITQNFTLASFDGGTLSATHSTSEHSAWRLGLGTSVSTARSSGDGGLQIGDSTIVVVPGSKNNNDHAFVSLLAERLHRFHPARHVGAYFATGPDLSWQRFHNGSRQPSYQPDTWTVLDHYSHTITLGIDADLGAEVILARSVGLFAQYGSTGGYRFTRETTRAQQQTTAGVPLGAPGAAKVHNNQWFLDSENVRFGLSLFL